MSVGALVLGAGRGERFRASGGNTAIPKALAVLEGRTLLARSIRTLAAVPQMMCVVPVVSAAVEAHWPAVERELREDGADVDRVRPPVLGGEERHDSVRAGLAALPSACTHVAVHDAARPLVTAADVVRVVEAGRDAGAACLARPVADTIHRGADGWITETPARETLWAAETPQVIRVDWLRAALEEALREGTVGTDDAGFAARAGHRVRLVASQSVNRKITTEADRLWAEAWLRVEEDSA